MSRRKQEPEKDYRYSYELNVAGVTKAGRQKTVRDLFPGLDLELVREPDNPHDENAVAVYCEGDQVGYVPEGKARMVADYLDHEKPVEAHVISVDEWENDAGQTKLGVLMFLGFPEETLSKAEKMIAAGESTQKTGDSIAGAGKNVMGCGCSVVFLVIIALIWWAVAC